MYTVVLATMLSAGSATPAWHHHHSCFGCHSCYSSCSCFGGYSCYSGYSGYSGYACSSCYSCSSCNSCHRIFPIFHRHHCSSWGCSSYSCSCSGYYVNPCSCACSAPCSTGPRVIEVPADPKKEKITPPKKQAEETTARVTVELPRDAKLWVDNVSCPLTTGVRSFTTPPLAGNQQYFYNLKVEIVREGRTVSETQRVVITPGQETRVDFNNSAVIGTASR